MREFAYNVTLTCRSAITGKHHVLTFWEAPPYFGEEIYCRFCEEMSRVLIAPHEGRAECAGSDGLGGCGYDTRGHWGAGQARSRAKHHAERYPDHVLRIYLGRRVVCSVTALTWADVEISDDFARSA